MTERNDPITKSWGFDDDGFYSMVSRRKRIEFMLRYAVLAPSAHNRQAWSFHITDAGVDVLPDPARRLPVIDPDDRELTMSLGTAIANLRVAAAHFGFESNVLYRVAEAAAVPPAAVATVELRQTATPDAKLAGLFGAIRQRHTNRAPFDGEGIEPVALAALLDVVDQNPTTFHVVYRHDTQHTADLIAFAEGLLMADASYRVELTACDPDGAEAEQADGDRALAMSAAALLIVTAEDDPVSLLRAGEALEYLLLTITAAGLQYSFLNAPVHRADLRERVEMLAGAKSPQLILRIGHGVPVTDPSARRPLAAVVS
jgi:nitroreductase